MKVFFIDLRFRVFRFLLLEIKFLIRTFLLLTIDNDNDFTEHYEDVADGEKTATTGRGPMEKQLSQEEIHALSRTLQAKAVILALHQMLSPAVKGLPSKDLKVKCIIK